MFAKSVQVLVGFLVFLSTVNGIAIPDKRDLEQRFNVNSALSTAVSELSSIQSVGAPYASSALSVWSTASSSLISQASSIVSSALSVAASDASSVWSEVTDANGAQETGLVEYLAVVNGVTVTEISSANGAVITLAPSGQGFVTTFGGGVFTAARAVASASTNSAPGPSSSSSTSAGFKDAVPSILMGAVAVCALMVL